MDQDKKIIFPKENSITVEESDYKRSLHPYEQHKELAEVLNGWSEVAVNAFKKFGFSYEYAEGTDRPILIEYGQPQFQLTWLAAPLPDAYIHRADTEELLRADSVLRSIRELYEALASRECNRIANAAISVGIAVGVAHAEPFEKLAFIGRSVTDATKSKHIAKLKAEYQEWWRANPEKAGAVRNINDLLKQKACSEVKKSTMKKWFKEVYPDHKLQTGAPKTI